MSNNANTNLNALECVVFKRFYEHKDANNMPKEVVYLVGVLSKLLIVLVARNVLSESTVEMLTRRNE